MNPIEAVVEPLKNDAIVFARQKAIARILKTVTEFNENGWDANIIAPYPNSMKDDKETYHTKLNKYGWVRSITSYDQKTSGRVNAPEYRLRNEDLEIAKIQEWGDLAAVQYDSFVAKLINKIGNDVVKAELKGNHVWGHSILIITRADGSVEKWKTQTIFKLSKLGKPHNQWPTRKVK